MKLLGRIEEHLKTHACRGQAFVETALIIPILILLILGVVEIGAAANEYMIVHDAAREGGRFAANLDPELTSRYFFDNRDRCNPFPDVRPLSAEELRELCELSRTTNFYYEVACLTFQNVPLGRGRLDQTNGDDIVITVIGVRNEQVVSRWPIIEEHRYPGVEGDPECGSIPEDWPYHFQGSSYSEDPTESNGTCTAEFLENCRAWSFFGLTGSGIPNDQLNTLLPVNEVADVPNSAFVMVEIYHAIPHFTGLFNIGRYIPDPLPTRPFAVFPVSAAEPRD